MVKNTSLSDIIERDTSTDVMQADAFLTAERHASNVAAEDPNAPQLVVGTAGHATISGGSADDTLVANNGASLMGGGGDDTFVFDFNKNTTAVVRDFHSGDTLEINNATPAVDFSDLHITSHDAVTSVDIGHDHIQLVGVSHVSASDFLFHV